MVANLTATVISVAAGVAAVPIIVRALGLDAYGLVGFHAMLATILSAFDLGLSPSITRELARRSVVHGELGSYLATVMTIVWLVGLALGGCIATGSGLIASTWLSGETAAPVIMLMGAAIAAQWPAAAYRAALNGLERQVVASVISASAVVARTLGVAVLLVAGGGGVMTYFVAQIAISVVETLATRMALRHHLTPADRHARPRISALHGTLGFTSQIAVAGILGLVLTQVDRIVVSWKLPLEDLGLYTVAATLGSGIFRLAAPILSVAIPRFAKLAAVHDRERLGASMRDFAQAVAIGVLPVGATIAALPTASLLAWGQESAVVTGAAGATSLLVAGTSLHCLLHAPYALLLAFGAARSAVVFNACTLMILVPSVIIGTMHFGIEGAAIGWLVVVAVAFAGPVIALVAFLVPGFARPWVFGDVVAPVVAASAIPIGIALTVPTPTSRIGALAAIAIAWTMSTLATALAVPVGRRLLARARRALSPTPS